MKTTFFITGLILMLSIGLVSADPAMPSTNDNNRDLGWAHFNEVSSAPGEVTIEFVSTRGFWSCFEVRTDGDTSQIISTNGGVNFNGDITDGLYPYYCQNNNNQQITIPANEYVEIRMVFGAESDERFDWTVVEVEQLHEIPEFGVLAAIGILGVVGLFIYRRRE
jgi:hypothetical protein